MASKKESITYVGDIRLIGVIVDSATSKNTLGYVVYIEKQNKMQIISKPILFQLARRYKFSNIEIKDSKVECTECAIDNFPKYLSDGSKITKCLDDKKIYIIGEIIRGNKVAGYRVIASNGNMADISEKDIVESSGKGYILVNAHIRDNKSIVPNKEKNFNTIVQTLEEEKITVDHKQYNNYGHKTPDYCKEAFLRRLRLFAYSRSMKIPLPKGSYSIYTSGEHFKRIDKSTRELGLKKVALILKNEVYPLAKNSEEQTYVANVLKAFMNEISSGVSDATAIKIKTVCALLLREKHSKEYSEYIKCVDSIANLMNDNNISEVELPIEICEYYFNQIIKKITLYGYYSIDLPTFPKNIQKSIDIDGTKVRVVDYTNHSKKYIEAVIRHNGFKIKPLLVLPSYYITVGRECKGNTYRLCESTGNIELDFYRDYHITIKNLEDYYNEKINIIKIGKNDYNFSRMMLPTKFKDSYKAISIGSLANNQQVTGNEFSILTSDTTVVINNDTAYSGKELWYEWLNNYVSKQIGTVTSYLSNVSTTNTDRYIRGIYERIQIIVTLMSLFDSKKLNSLVSLDAENVNAKSKLLTGNIAVDENRLSLINKFALDERTISDIKVQEDLTDLETFYNIPLHIKINDKYIFIGHYSRHTNPETVSDIELTADTSELNGYQVLNNDINRIIENITTQLILITGLSEKQVIRAITKLPLYNLKN